MKKEEGGDRCRSGRIWRRLDLELARSGEDDREQGDILDHGGEAVERGASRELADPARGHRGMGLRRGTTHGIDLAVRSGAGMLEQPMDVDERRSSSLAMER